MTLTVGLVVRLEARPGREDDLSRFLAEALPLALAEEATPIWLAVRTSERTFWIVDANPDDAGRQAHLSGPIAAGLMSNADALLAAPPEIMMSTVVAAKPAS
jgi:quinol monooxygenase YgiN